MKQIAITIDTEIGELTHDEPDAFNTFVQGRVGGEEVGWRAITNILEEYGARGSYFVDVYGHKKVGVGPFRRLCEELTARGHRTELHTHPSSAFDPSRPFLYQYSLAEQTEIVEYGKHLIEAWTGRPPTAHRAGAYGANGDSLVACAQAGIRTDCSWFCGHRNCPLDFPHVNRPSLVGQVMEVPVTVFTRRLGLGRLRARRKLPAPDGERRPEDMQKLDLRCGASVAEIQQVVDCSHPDAVCVLFVHSFEFLDILFDPRRRRCTRVRVNRTRIRKLRALLEWIGKRADARFATVDTLDLQSPPEDHWVEVRGDGVRRVRQSLVRSLSRRFARRISL